MFLPAAQRSTSVQFTKGSHRRRLAAKNTPVFPVRAIKEPGVFSD
jgi:hypothetical protein